MHKGQKFEHQFSVTEATYNGFVEIFQDKNPLHTDTDFARAKGFKDKVMHGNILNGFVSYFIGECLDNKNVIIHHQSIQYTLPVYLGDKLILNAEIKDYFESVNAYEFSFYFSNADNKKVAKGNIQIGVLI